MAIVSKVESTKAGKKQAIKNQSIISIQSDEVDCERDESITLSSNFHMSLYISE